MSTLAERMGSTANRLVNQFGASATFTKVAAASYDPQAGEVTGTDTAYQVKAVIGRAGKGRADRGQGSNEFVNAILAGTAVPTPVPGDKLTVLGSTYQIVRTLSTLVAGTAVVHEVEIAR